MKTPTDVFNNMQVILAHIEDIKSSKAITTQVNGGEKVFGKKPSDVFQRTIEMLEILSDLSTNMRTGGIDIPDMPGEVLPRDIFNNTAKVAQCLFSIKRRLGIADQCVPEKARIRISPSHVYAETERIIEELRVLHSALA